MKIVRLEAENVKRLRAVSIEPSGSVVVIGGKNGQGKSSLLDAIEMALGGAGAIPPEPIRRGARSARIVVNLGDLVVERVFSARGTQLVVKNAQDVTQKSPQALLNDLCSRVAFDPLEFARMDPPKQDEVLKRLLKIDFSELDGEREKVFKERAAENILVKELKVRVDTMPQHPDAPAQLVSAEELTASLQNTIATREANEQERQALAKRVETVRDLKVDLIEAEKDVADAEAQLAEARLGLGAVVGQLKCAEDQVALQTELVKALTEPDISEIKTRIADVEQTNRKVRENLARASLKEELGKHLQRAHELTSQIEAIDTQKAEVLSAAEFPVPGLGFDEAGPTLNGIPLEQACQSERLRVSVAIGLALNPKLKVLLVRDGSLLDADSMALLGEMAEAASAQVWVERVSETGEGCSLVIEDGHARDMEPLAAE